MRFTPRRDGLHGGHSRTYGPQLRCRGGVAVIVCPVTGLEVHVDEAVMRNGSLVHPLANDELGVDERDHGTITPARLVRAPIRNARRSR